MDKTPSGSDCRLKQRKRAAAENAFNFQGR